MGADKGSCVPLHACAVADVDAVVTGANGLLGRAVLGAAPPGWRVHGTTRQELDLAHSQAVRTALAHWRPGYIIHCAAYTQVDQAEVEPERAYADNVLATWNLATVAAELNAVLLLVSTDYVFDGRASRPYQEFDPPGPVNLYGRSKWMAEVLVRQQVRRHLIVRTSGLFGPGGRHFVERILAKARAGEALRVVSDQICCRTYTPDLAWGLWSLLDSPLYGVYHLTNQGFSSWFAFAEEILRQAGINALLEPVTTSHLNLLADRPRYSVLDDFCWRLTGHPPLRPVEQAITEYLKYEETVVRRS